MIIYKLCVLLCSLLSLASLWTTKQIANHRYNLEYRILQFFAFRRLDFDAVDLPFELCQH